MVTRSGQFSVVSKPERYQGHVISFNTHEVEIREFIHVDSDTVSTVSTVGSWRITLGESERSQGPQQDLCEKLPEGCEEDLQL